MPLFEDLGNHRQEDPAGNTNTQKNHIFNLKKIEFQKLNLSSNITIF